MPPRAMQRPPTPALAAQLFGASPEHRLILMRAAWPAAVGPELARRTEVVTLDGSVLRVRVPDASWQRGLARMRGDILRRLRQIAGSAAPRSLGFVLGAVSTPPNADSLAAPGARRGAPPAPSRPAPAEVRAAAEAIPDSQLRERFLAAAARYLERFSASGSG